MLQFHQYKTPEKETQVRAKKCLAQVELSNLKEGHASLLVTLLLFDVTGNAL